MLLNAWGWGTVGAIAVLAGIVLVAIGALLLVAPVLTALARRRREGAGRAATAAA